MQIQEYILPEIGITLDNAGSTADDKAAISKNTLHSRYVRNAIPTFSWSGSNAGYEAFRSNSLVQHVVLRTQPTGLGDQPWITDPTDLAAHAVVVDDILTTYPEIELVIVSNEEMNTLYHSGTIAEYITQCEAIKDVCKAHNVLIANGGIGDFFPINAFVFRYVKALYGQDAADAFGALTFISTAQYNAANTPDSNPSLETRITNLTQIVEADVFDVFNFHMYEPTGDQTNAADAVAANEIFWRYSYECFSNAHPTKRRHVACNESGPRTSQHGELITSMLSTAWKYGYIFFDIWSGNGAILNTSPLTDDDGVINSLGQAYADWQDDHYESISLA